MWQVFLAYDFMASRESTHYTDLLKEARQLEDEGSMEPAAAGYERAIRQSPLEEEPYFRLMVLYRKLKEPEKELKAIEKGLKVFISAYDRRLKKYSGQDRLGKASKALLRTITGSTKLKINYPDPIPKWMKRKETVEKKLRK